MVLRVVLSIVAAVAVVLIPPPLLAAAEAHGPAASPSYDRGLVTDAVPVPAGSSVTPLASATPLRLAFTLPFSNESRLTAQLAALSNSSSPDDRRFLSYATFQREFGPSRASISSVEAALRASGASPVTVAPGGLTVDATLTAGETDSLLDVEMVEYEDGGSGPGYTAVGAPRLPTALVGDVAGIDGLSSTSPGPIDARSLQELTVPQPVPADAGQFVQGNSSSRPEWFVGTDYAQAYGATELLPGNRSVTGQTYPHNIAIATLLASAYNVTTSTTLPPWTPSVVDRYFNDTFPSGWPLPSVTGVRVNESGAALPPLPGSFDRQNDSTGFETENSLDLEMAGSLAPGSSLFNFYFSGALLANPTTSGDAPEYLADDFGAALAYHYGAAHLAVVSCSFGLADVNDTQWDSELIVAQFMGVTVVASSGDQGNAPDTATGRDDGPWPLWPATAAFNTSGVISVGGVSVALSGSPTANYSSPPLVVRYDTGVEGIANASVWWDTSGGAGRDAGTEGGTSRLYVEPYWQVHSAAQWPIVNATEREGFGQLGRAGPDVAFPANSTIAYISAYPNGSPVFAVLGGTSVAAPVFAGLLADVVAVENATVGGVPGLGFIDPELYRVGSYYRANPGSLDPFIPVLYGSNYLFSAGPGWTAATGWGGVFAPLLLTADENATVANYTYSGPSPKLPAPGSPPLSVVTVAIIASAAAAIVVASALLVSSRRRRSAVEPGPGGGYAWPSAPGPTGGGPPRPFATFSCPYCGAERPAEPGHCPSCGAM